MVSSSVEIISWVDPPGASGLINKLAGRAGVATIVNEAVGAFEAGAIDAETYLSEIRRALGRLDAYRDQLASKVGNH